MATNLFYGSNPVPGVSTNERMVDENNILQGRWEHTQWFQGTVASTAIDPGSSVTTNLRHGLLMGKDSNGEYVQYDPGQDDATVGSHGCEAILLKSLSTLGVEGTAEDKQSGSLLVSGIIDPSKLVIGENSTRGIIGDEFEFDVRKQLAGCGNFIFEDNPVECPLGTWKYEDAKTADYQLTEADSDILWTNEGDADAINFTLPADSGAIPGAKKGLAYYFYVVADFNFTITSGTADKLMLDNDIAADSISFQTAGELIGNHVAVIGDGAKWKVYMSLAAEDVTITVAT